MMKIDNSFIKQLSLISHVGLLMATPIILCILLGNYLDKILETKIIFLLIFTIVGVMTAFRNLWMLGKKQSQQRKKD